MILARSLQVAAIAFVSGCSVYDGMKNMEKNTEEMNRTTREMYQTTREMKDSTADMNSKTSQMSADTQIMRRATENMAETTQAMHSETMGLKKISTELDRQTGDLYQDARQGTSLELRLNILEQMNQAKKQFAKIKYANFYLKSLEFQLWKAAGRDDDQRLDTLQLEAVQEVIQTIDELSPEGARSLSPLSNSNRMQNLYAISAALHVLNQVKHLPDPNGTSDHHDLDLDLEGESHEPTGILKLLFDALKAKKSLEDGTLEPEHLKPYQASVLKFEEIATYILRLRVNFLTAITVKQLASEDGESLNLIKRIKMWLRPWQPKVDVRNTVQLRYYGWVLSEAKATRDNLKSLGIDAPLDPMLQRVMGHIDFGPSSKSSSSEKNSVVKALQAKLSALSN